MGDGEWTGGAIDEPEPIIGGKTVGGAFDEPVPMIGGKSTKWITGSMKDNGPEGE